MRCHRVLAAATLALALLVPAVPAFAAPSSAEVSESRERVERAVQRLEQQRAKAARADAELEQAAERLDLIVDEQQEARARLTSRARSMYRSGEVGFVSVLLSATTFEEFTTRWLFLTRMNRHDAETIQRLERTRQQARVASDELLRMQERSARLADEIERELARARAELADDQAALAAYRARAAARGTADRHRGARVVNARPAAAPAARAVKPKGQWRTSVASHYGINFTGRGASGKPIGPYSMMVAHKTLPFGTLVEFEYRGKRAIASVEDRGPHVAGREWDLGPGVTRVLNFRGVEEVRWRIVER